MKELVANLGSPRQIRSIGKHSILHSVVGYAAADAVFFTTKRTKDTKKRMIYIFSFRELRVLRGEFLMYTGMRDIHLVSRGWATRLFDTSPHWTENEDLGLR